uniref:Uncharacterized protein n=1 Tax=Tanacetum cinerariifolium TaxID=118510 RepID=A0A6L2JYD1_TANCI|nr:hypothetical protein [Tanacetum cinerariifolium]
MGKKKDDVNVQKEEKKKDIVKKKDVILRKKRSITIVDKILHVSKEAVKLAESISLTEAELQDEDHRLHETHASLIIRKEAKEIADTGEIKESEDDEGSRASKEEYILKHIPKDSSEGFGVILGVPDKPMIASDKSEKDGSEKAESGHDDEETAAEEIVDTEKADEKQADEEHANKEMADEEKVDEEKPKEEKADDKQARADQADDDQAKEDQAEHLDLHNALSIGIDEAIAKGETDLSKVLKKRRHDEKDKDPFVDSKKGKKKRRQKDFKPSKDKEPTHSLKKGKAASQPSKNDKYVNVEEVVQDAAIETEEQVLDDVVNVDEQPQADAAPKLDNSIWFRQDTIIRPETPNSEWHKKPNADDTQEHNWFNKMVNAEKDPLTFDDLMDDPDREVLVAETFDGKTNDKLTKNEVKKIEADDQAIQIILIGLPEDIYAIVDSCQTAQKIWLRVQQIMKGSDIGIQDKKDKLFNEW